MLIRRIHILLAVTTLAFASLGIVQAQTDNHSWKVTIQAADYARSIDNFEEEEELLKQALQAANAASETGQIGSTVSRLNVIYINSDRLPQAEKLCTDELRYISAHKGDLRDMRSVTVSLGNVYQHQRKYTLAMRNYRRALAMTDQLTIADPLELSAPLQAMTLTCLKQRKIELAEQYFERLIALYKSKGIPLMSVIRDLQTMAELHARAKHYDKANKTYLELISLCKEHPDEHLCAGCYASYAHYLHGLHRDSEAAKFDSMEVGQNNSH